MLADWSTPLAVEVLRWQSKYSAGSRSTPLADWSTPLADWSTPLAVKVLRCGWWKSPLGLPRPALDTAVLHCGVYHGETVPNSWSADVDLGRTDGAEHQTQSEVREELVATRHRHPTKLRRIAFCASSQIVINYGADICDNSAKSLPVNI